jgi:riboflavin synthase
MFTGLIEAIGTVTAVRPSGAGLVLEVEPGPAASGHGRFGEGAALGASIAVNGVCLTVTAPVRGGAGGPSSGSAPGSAGRSSGSAPGSSGRLRFDVSPETAARTTFAAARPGTRVHLEQALRFGDRLDGHLVQGHVDGLATVDGTGRDGDAWRCSYRLPAELLPQVVLKGSIALDGVSLTVAALEGDRVTVAVVPHTAAHTLLVGLSDGARVHVETDIIGKYVARLLGLGASGGAGPGSATRPALDAAFLAAHGFVGRR